MVARKPYPQDHSTHMPVLVSLAKAFKIRNVLEYGAGVYSTPLFLDKKVFPDLERILSVEPEEEWQQKVKEAIGWDDPRLSFVSSMYYNIGVQYSDLVLVDNGPEQHKINTIRHMRDQVESCPDTLFVIHDAEHIPYRQIVETFPYYQIYEGMNPATAVCSAKRLNWSVDSVEGW